MTNPRNTPLGHEALALARRYGIESPDRIYQLLSRGWSPDAVGAMLEALHGLSTGGPSGEV